MKPFETTFCSALKCTKHVGLDAVMCSRHWMMIPASLREEIIDNYDDPTELTKALLKAVKFIMVKESDA